MIVEPHPLARHKRKRGDVIARLERARQGTPAELVLQFVETHPACDAQAIAQANALDETTTQAAIQALVASGELFDLGDARATFYLARSTWTRWLAQVERELDAYHQLFPLRAGMGREELKRRLNLAPRALEFVLARGTAENVLRVTEKFVARAAHQIGFDAAAQRKVDALLEQFERAPYNPPSVADAEAAIGAEALNALVEQNILERVAPNVLFKTETARTMQAWVIETLQTQNEITAAQVRDHFDTSRKYAIAFLEYLDAKRITRRVGDARVLR